MRLQDFPYVHPISTRWDDNDVYGHVNNVRYFAFFDTAINAWLIAEGGLDIEHGDVIGVCAESHCAYTAAIATAAVALAAILAVLTSWLFGFGPPLPAPLLLVIGIVLLVVYLATASWVLADGPRRRPWLPASRSQWQTRR